MAVLKATRRTMLELLSEDRPTGETLALALLYGCQAQSELDSGEIQPFDASSALETAEEAQRQLEISRMQESMRYALIFVSSAPVLIAYPFVQKHFVKGVLIGSVKG